MATKVQSLPKFPQAGWAGVKLKGWTANAVNKIKARKSGKGAKRAA